MDIKIVSKRFNCDVSLNHKITIFIGDSGVGKTQFVKALTDKSGAYKVSMSEDYKVYKLTRDSWYFIMDGIEATQEKSILIVDDEDFVFKNEFANKFKHNKSSYLIIVGRTNIIQDRIESWNNLPVATNALKEFIGEGKEHRIIDALEYNIVSADSINIDICLCEDKKSGFTFFSKIFKETCSSDGKDKLLKCIITNKQLFANKSVYLCIDSAASGVLLRDVFYLLSELGSRLVFCNKYESFEYLLLRSNFFNITDEEIWSDILSYLSLERRCTNLLKEITKNEIYAYSKGNLSECFYENCCMKDRSKTQCNKGLGGDKITALLIGTEFEFLLKLRQV